MAIFNNIVTHFADFIPNKYFPTDIRLNYEKYWYPRSGTPKESEQDKLVAELMIHF